MGMMLRRHVADDAVAEVVPEVDEISALRKEADALGLQYHPNIGVEKLRAKIGAARAAE